RNAIPSAENIQKPKHTTQNVQIFIILAIRGLAGEGIRDGLNLEMIGQIKVPVPKKSEQVNIAEFLDKHTSRIDQSINKIEQKINLLEEYKKSLIHHVVTGKIDVGS
ncbi:MAG: restriction endonuclease subunit S, partial [Candidatus Altiarchaeota archaeon]|nr:restriction endonuclease subunit S [Candidatus Altiarchaeota archaeon]